MHSIFDVGPCDIEGVSRLQNRKVAAGVMV